VYYCLEQHYNYAPIFEIGNPETIYSFKKSGIDFLEATTSFPKSGMRKERRCSGGDHNEK
jgi:hypothetical protein